SSSLHSRVQRCASKNVPLQVNPAAHAFGSVSSHTGKSPSVPLGTQPKVPFAARSHFWFAPQPVWWIGSHVKGLPPSVGPSGDPSLSMPASWAVTGASGTSPAGGFDEPPPQAASARQDRTAPKNG